MKTQAESLELELLYHTDLSSTSGVKRAKDNMLEGSIQLYRCRSRNKKGNVLSGTFKLGMLQKLKCDI